MVLTSYNCTQTELYKACRFVWLLCQEHLTEFSDYKSIYTAAYIAENFKLISSVETLDDHAARTAPIKDLRKELVAEKTDASDFFKLLKGYISTAYSTDTFTRDSKQDEAGQAYYEKVSSGSWAEVAGLMTAMIPFIQTNKEVLMEKGFMPESFLTRLQDKQVSFKAAKQKWETESLSTSSSTDAKITANNDLKARAMSVISDGQLAFIKKKDIAQKFVWTTIVSQMRPTKPTGLGGKITDIVTKKGLAQVTATIDSLGLTVTCSDDGRYEFMPLEAGIYTIEFKTEGYKPIVVTAREVVGGTKGRLNVAMEAVAAVATA